MSGDCEISFLSLVLFALILSSVAICLIGMFKSDAGDE